MCMGQPAGGQVLSRSCGCATGLGCFTMSFLISLYYNTVLSWVLWYFLNSFQHPLPWSSCPLDLNLTGKMRASPASPEPLRAPQRAHLKPSLYPGCLPTAGPGAHRNPTAHSTAPGPLPQEGSRWDCHLTAPGLWAQTPAKDSIWGHLCDVEESSAQQLAGEAVSAQFSSCLGLVQARVGTF